MRAARFSGVRSADCVLLFCACMTDRLFQINSGHASLAGGFAPRGLDREAFEFPLPTFRLPRPDDGEFRQCCRRPIALRNCVWTRRAVAVADRLLPVRPELCSKLATAMGRMRAVAGLQARKPFVEQRSGESQRTGSGQAEAWSRVAGKPADDGDKTRHEWLLRYRGDRTKPAVGNRHTAGGGRNAARRTLGRANIHGTVETRAAETEAERGAGVGIKPPNGGTTPPPPLVKNQFGPWPRSCPRRRLRKRCCPCFAFRQ